MAKFIDLQNTEYPIPDQEVVTIGSGKKCDVVLSMFDISREHARLYKNSNGRPLLRDSHSEKGTWVRGASLNDGQPVGLLDGDEVKFADYRFKYVG